MEWRNLRIWFTNADKSVPRSFDLLRSLRMTTAFVVIVLYMLMKADNHIDHLEMPIRKTLCILHSAFLYPVPFARATMAFANSSAAVRASGRVLPAAPTSMSRAPGDRSWLNR